MRTDGYEWTWQRLDDLGGRQLHAILAAREAVFVVEQQCAYQEADGRDLHAWHLTAWAAGHVAGYLRVVDPGRKYAEPSLGRVLTTAAFRGMGLGRRLVDEGLRRCALAFPGEAIRISAQQRLERFYREFGFQVVSEPYLEDGIPHVEMLRPSAPADE